jgi:MFS family permease
MNWKGDKKGEIEMTSEREFMIAEHRHSERRERQRLVGLWWAVVLIWAGLIFGADSMGLLPQIGDADSWSWVFLGAGVFGILGALYRVTSADVPNPTTWDWVWGSFCLIIGLGGFTTMNIAWPLVLILVGVVILVIGLFRRY